MGSIYPGGLDSFPTTRVDATPMATTQADDHNDYADAINKIEATLGVDPQGAYATVVDRLDSGGSSTILSSSTDLSSADLLDLHNTSVDLLPAPGGRLYYVILGLDLHYRFVTTPYNESIGTRFRIGYGSTVAEVTTDGLISFPLSAGSGVPATTLFQESADFYVPSTTALTGENINANMFSAAFVENHPVGLGIQSGFSLTGGDSTLTVHIYYSVIDGAP